MSLKEIPPGYEGRVEIVVTEEMTVDFEELGRVHPVYATYWMAKHMEEAGRKIILPFLEEGDEGIGAAVAVSHLGSAVPGMRVEVIAEHDRTERRRVFATCRAYNELRDLIGKGRTEQVIAPHGDIAARFLELERRWTEVREGAG